MAHIQCQSIVITKDGWFRDRHGALVVEKLTPLMLPIYTQPASFHSKVCVKCHIGMKKELISLIFQNVTRIFLGPPGKVVQWEPWSFLWIPKAGGHSLGKPYNKVDGNDTQAWQPPSACFIQGMFEMMSELTVTGRHHNNLLTYFKGSVWNYFQSRT